MVLNSAMHGGLCDTSFMARLLSNCLLWNLDENTETPHASEGSCLGLFDEGHALRPTINRAAMAVMLLATAAAAALQRQGGGQLGTVAGTAVAMEASATAADAAPAAVAVVDAARARTSVMESIGSRRIGGYRKNSRSARHSRHTA
mmetsp:Transcript_153554/g.490936  ORF Transcript_153554/g.490936 Transcript_153554/m.490936 type:complete len:146 (-) Transcript_153554:636-1073(-)